MLALAALVAGCDGASPDNSTSPKAGESGELTEADSPLDQALEGIGGYTAMTQEEQAAYYTDLHRRSEEVVAECMADQGFEYIPVDNTAYQGPSVLEGYGTREWMLQYGYGIATLAGEETSSEDTNPNQDLLDQMSEAEQAAWNVALWGNSRFDPDAPELPTDPDAVGCKERAEQEVWAQDERQSAVTDVWAQPTFAELREGMTALSDTDDTAALEGVAQEWSDCMAQAGYSGLENPPAAVAFISDQVEERYTEANADQDPGSGTTEVIEPDLTDLAAVEIAVATADLGCQEEAGYQQEQLRLRFEREQEFVDAHREDIEALKIAIEQTQAG